jgi:hypothetical protein
MVGTGIFSTPATILRLTDSVGLALIYWVIGFILAAAGLGVYLEFTSFFPNRSGSEVVWLQQSFPTPKHIFPVTFAVQSVLLSFSSSNAIVLSNYLWRIVGRAPDPWELKGIAIAAYTFAVICVIAHSRYSLWALNGIGALKILLLVLISISGLVILRGHTPRVTNPGINFKNGKAMSGTTSSGYALSQAMVNISFAYSGRQNAFNMANEIKNPLPTLKKNATASLLIVFTLYLLRNIAYFATVPKDVFHQVERVGRSCILPYCFRIGRRVGPQLLCPAHFFWQPTRRLSRPVPIDPRDCPLRYASMDGVLGINKAFRYAFSPLPYQVGVHHHYDCGTSSGQRLPVRRLAKVIPRGHVPRGLWRGAHFPPPASRPVWYSSIRF